MRGMIITRFERTIYPNTPKGKELAEYMAFKLKEQGVFKDWIEDTCTIAIEAEYVFKIEDGEQE